MKVISLKRILAPFKNFWKQIFSRILFIYSITIIVVISMFLFFIGKFYVNSTIERAVEANQNFLDTAKDYIGSRNHLLNSSMISLYNNADLLESMSYALRNEPTDYWEFRLERYAESNSFVPTNVDSFINSFQHMDREIDAIILTGTEMDVSYTYVFNYYHWNLMNPNGSHGPDENSITITKPIYEEFARNKIGNLKAYYSKERLNSHLNFMDSNREGMVQIYNLDRELIYSTRNDLDDLNFPLVVENHETSTWKHENETYYINYQEDMNLGLIFVGIVPESEIKEISITYLTVISIIIIISVFIVVIGYVVMRRYAKRMNDIKRNMLKVQDGDLSARIKVNQVDKDELATIANSFNQMIERLEYNIKRTYFLEIANQRAELRALQSQINPHFLYNTLEGIRMKALIEGAEDAASMVYHLANTLRYSLSNVPIVKIKDELQHLKQYMNIMEYRYGNKIKVTYDVDDQLLTAHIIRFVFQPLAENYIIHGFQSDRDDNRLTVQIKHADEHTIKVTFSDNGGGIEANRLQEIYNKLYGEKESQSDTSIGLYNIHRRIQLQYGKQYGLQIDSIKNKGAIVSITIPKNGKNNDVRPFQSE